MANSIQPGVEKLVDSPRKRNDVSLIVGVDDSSSESVIGRIEDTGATVEESLFYDNLAVAIDEETDLETLCTLEEVTSVEIEGVWEPMDEGNFRTPGTAPR